MADRKVNIGVGYTLDKSGLEEMQSYFQRIANQAAEPGNKLKAGLQQAGQTAKTLDKILEKTFNTNLGTLNVTKFNQEMQKSGLTMKQVKADLTGIGDQGVMAYNRLAQAILGTNLQLKQSSKLLNDMFTTFKNTVRYGISSSIFNNFTNSVQKAYEYTRKLDTSLNNIRIVTGKSADEMDKFAEKANNAAKELSASTLDMTQASLIYYQQGLSDAEVEARAETTVKVANVTGQKADEVSEQLTSVWNGYKVTAAETELYIDKLAAVAATTAADLEELSTGMSKVASAAASMGVNFDDLTAQISTIVSVTRQAPESVGTALKTIYARIGDLKVDGVDEFGVKLGEVSSQLEVMGINILDQEGNMRDMSSIMAEVAEKWQYWTEAQKQAAAVAIAGKRQYNNLIALFENWGMYTEALNTSKEAMGTLQKQQDVYMESTQAKLTKLRATWQDLYKSVGNTDTINTFIDGITNLVQVFDNFSDSFGGGLKSIIAFGTIIANIFNKQIAESIKNIALKSDQLTQNVNTAKAKFEVAKENLAQGSPDNAQLAANVENTRTQLQIAEQIRDVESGLTEEQYNQATQYQQILGSLKEEEVILKRNMESVLQEVKSVKDLDIAEEDYKKVLEGNEGIYNEILVKIQEKAEEKKKEIALDEQEKAVIEAILNKQETAYKSKEKNNKAFQKYREDLLTLINSTDLKEKEELANIIKSAKNLKDLKNSMADYSDIVSKIPGEHKKELAEMEKITKELEQQKEYSDDINKNANQQQNTRIDLDSIIETGEKSIDIMQAVTTATSALSTFAMAWSSIDSLLQTWNDENAAFGDKITQTFMSLGMVIPILISNWNKLNETFGASSGLFQTLNALFNSTTAAIRENIAATTAKNSVDVISDSQRKSEIVNTASLIFAKQQDALITGEVTAEEITQNFIEAASIELEEGEQIALIDLIKAKIAHAKATGAAKAANDAFNASLLANPIVLVIAAIAGLTAGIAALISIEKKHTQAIIDNNKATIDSINSRQEEINTNQELYKSYENLYEQYKQHLITKEELGKTAEEIAQKYGIELTALEKLTGQYDEFTQKVKTAREEELKESIQLNKEKSIAAGDTLRQNLKSTKKGHITGDQYRFQWDQGADLNDDFKSAQILEKQGVYSYNEKLGEDGAYGFILNANNAQEIIDTYDKMVAAKKEMDVTMSSTEKADSELYQQTLDWIENTKESVETYKEAYEVVKNGQAELALGSIDFASVSTMGEFNTAMELAYKKLDEFGIKEEEQKKLLDAYLATSGNAFIQNALALDRLGQKLHFTETQLKKISDVDFLLKGGLSLNDLEGLSPEQINQLIATKKAEGTSQDFDTIASLRNKITSSSKLSKSDMQEKLKEESQLAQDFVAELTDFENASQLKQLDSLNYITSERIKAEQNYLENWKKINEEKLNLAKEQQEQLKKFYFGEESKEYQDLLVTFQDIAKQKVEGIKNNSWTEAQEEQYKEAKKALDDYTNHAKNQIKNVEDSVLQLTELLEAGLSLDEINSSIFTMMIDGIDGVISETKLLKDLTADIGEGWVIATEDIENFIKNFPELVQDQKNYNILADGSIKITEEGQKAYKEQLELRKDDLAAQVKAYTLEIQKQIDMKEATRDYYLQQADLLEQSLKAGADANEIKAKMEQNLANYVGKMQEITGEQNTDLTNQILENTRMTGKQEQMTVQEIAGYYEDLGRMIEASFATMETKKFELPTMKHLNVSGSSAGSAKQYDASKYFGVYDTLLEQDDAFIKQQIQNFRSAATQIDNELSTLASKKISAESMLTSFENDLDNIGKSKDKDKKDKQKEFDDEFDRYYDIKKAIELVGNALEKVDKIQSKLHGKELIQSLKNENDLIKQQAANYEELYRQQQIELAEVQQSLKGVGAEFDKNGFLTNYATLTSSVLEQYQDAIAKKNAGIISDEALQAYEKAYNDVKDQVDRYNELFYNEMKDTQDKLDEYNRQTMENNLKIWETEIQIKLDTSQAERDWMDFLKEINNDFRKVYKNLNIEMDHFVAKMETYSGMNTIETDLQAIKDVVVEIDKINSGKTSSMFESISDAQEKLKELDQQLETDAKDMKQLWQDAWDAYLEGIDQSNDKLEFMNDRFEKINEELEFQGRLIELLYGEEAYSLMNKLYKGQEVAAQNNISSIKTQADLWHQLWEESGATLQNQADWTSDQEKYYENWQEQQSKLNDLITSYIELLQKDYLNTVNDVLAQLEKAMTGGNTLEDIKDQWDKITAYSDKYYDGIEHALEVQKFANKIDADIAKTVGIKNQQKLEAIREKEITYLREKKNLTQYDMEAAEARYQIALKEIALEEAQANKTSMKLVRNEEGNWAYQYMADADDVAQKQDDLLTSYGDLYRLAGDAYQNNLEEMQSLEEQYLESQRKIYEDLYMSDEEKTQRLVELGEWYQETMNRLAEENELYRQDLKVAGAGTLLQVYNQDQEAYEFMTAAEQAMLDSLIGASISSYQELEVRCAENYNHIQEASAHAMTLIREDWTSSAQQIADTWAADDGQSVMSQVTWAQEQIGQAALDYQTLVDECASQVERDFGPDGVSGSINEATQKTHDLQDAIAELCDTSKTQLDSLKKTLGQVELAWMAQKNRVSDAIEEVKRYIAIIGKANQIAAKSYGVTGGAGSLGDFDINGNEIGNGSGTGNGPFDFAAGDYIIMGRDGHADNRIVTISNNNGKGFKEEDLAAAAAKFKIKESPEITEVKKVPKWLEENIFKKQKWQTGVEDFAFRTGGYTGEWGEDGRLAFLHQKELVLNANDTANFLNGVSLLRDMVSLNGSIEKSIAAAIGGMAMQLSGMSASKISTGSGQAAPALAGDTYYVTADFPNANNAEEIKQAILNLPNIVSQALGKNNI